MKILYYELIETIHEGRLLESLIKLGLRTEALLPNLSHFPFIKADSFDLAHLTQAIRYEANAKNPSAERISLRSIQEQLQGDGPNGKFAVQTRKIIDLLITSAAQSSPDESNPPDDISVHSLMALCAYTCGLDALNFGSVFVQALPLTPSQTSESKLVEAVYEICHARVKPSMAAGKAITWVAAAVLSTLADFDVPPFRFLQKVNNQPDLDGSQVGSLSVVVGELEIAEDKAIALIQTNIDDMSPQLLSHAITRLFEAGALDIYQTPIYMKKNRLGIQLNVVVRQRDEAKLANLILKETTTLGVNVRPLDHRYHVDVRMLQVETKYGSIPVKQKFLDGILIQSRPEYETIAKIASETHVSLEELQTEIAGQLNPKISLS